MQFFKNYKKHRKLARKIKAQNELVWKAQLLKKQLAVALELCDEDIPVIVVCYNNAVYLENMVLQLAEFNIKPVVIDNASSDDKTVASIKLLASESKIYLARSDHNLGHLAGFLPSVFDVLPEVFAYTDPDLQLNKKLPLNFLSVLKKIATDLNVFKAGFALDLCGGEQIIPTVIENRLGAPFYQNFSHSIRDFEERFWRVKVDYPGYEIWSAEVDTTFAVYKKSNYYGHFYDGVRVAGDFSSIHLPWFPRLDLFDKSSRDIYLTNNVSSTTWGV